MSLSRKGKFGKVSVRKTGGITALLIEDGVQGSAFDKPSASVVDDKLEGPGPCSYSPYTYGWLLAGTQVPYGSGLMIGLGSGIGAVMLLYSFPNIDLTLVEIDPVIVDVAIRTFPLIEHFVNQGRLNIVIEDANKYLADSNDKFHFGFADAYTGNGHEHVTSFHKLLAEKCENVYLNVIDTVPGKLTSGVVHNFEKFGKPITHAFRAGHIDMFGNAGHIDNAKQTANWILTTATLDWQKVDSFEPFENLSGAAAEYGRALWLQLIANPLAVKGSGQSVSSK